MHIEELSAAELAREIDAFAALLHACVHAGAEGRTLLTLDTREDDAAEPLYRSLGYQAVGVIPRYARAPESDRLDGTVIMLKELS